MSNNTKEKKIIITGSHFTPAQAVIEELQKVEPTIQITYIGRKHTLEGTKALSVESQVLPSMGIKFISLTTGRLKRSLGFDTIWSLIKIPFGMVQAFYLVWREKPQLVVSFGGYVAVPVVVSAWILSVPILIHEQTIVSGLANRISSIFANKIALTFVENNSFPKSKVILTGNPIRKEILDPAQTSISSEVQKFISKQKKESLPLLLITGGNQGAHTINQTVSEIIEQLLKNFFVIHQTGDSNYQDFEKLSEQKESLQNNDRYLLQKWIDSSDMAKIFRSAEIVVGRAGINTLLELSYFAIPTVVIPLPGLTKNEQEVNAEYFKKHGLAHPIKQSTLTSAKLLSEINEVRKNLAKYKQQAIKSQEIVVKDASQRLTVEILQLLYQRGW